MGKGKEVARKGKGKVRGRGREERGRDGEESSKKKEKGRYVPSSYATRNRFILLGLAGEGVGILKYTNVTH